MCGRFTLRTPPEALARHFELDEVHELRPRFNVAPGQDIATLLRREAAPRRALELRRWGLVPSWVRDPQKSPAPINARSETVAEKPMFQAALRRRRCLVPADGFYEWARPSRQPFHVRRADGAPFGIAGLWERWEGPEGQLLESCALLTTQANECVRPIHPRMPVILEPRDYDVWLDPEIEDPQRVLPLLRPHPAEGMLAQAVARRVNRAGFDDPSCLEPAAAVLADPAAPQRELFGEEP